MLLGRVPWEAREDTVRVGGKAGDEGIIVVARHGTDIMTSRLPHNKAWKEAGDILDDEHPICPSIHPSQYGNSSFYPTFYHSGINNNHGKEKFADKFPELVMTV